MKYEQARELVEAALNEMATPRVAKKLKDYKSKSARQREAEKRYPLGHQKKGVSMRQQSTMRSTTAA
jgi:anaerobic ribonucleoside-triphosphate reductase